MSRPPEKLSPIAQAMAWVARITAVAFEMVLPGLAGLWLDQRFGTRLLVMVGFAMGLIAGVWHLIWMASREEAEDAKQTRQGDSSRDDIKQ